eukprot:356041-Chlamydomonas_euryale.AAC.5
MDERGREAPLVQKARWPRCNTRDHDRCPPNDGYASSVVQAALLRSSASSLGNVGAWEELEAGGDSQRQGS